MQASWREGPVAGHWWVELGLGPQVGRAVSRGGSRGSCGLFSLQAACLLMGGAVSPPPPPPPCQVLMIQDVGRQECSCS